MPFHVLPVNIIYFIQAGIQASEALSDPKNVICLKNSIIRNKRTIALHI